MNKFKALLEKRNELVGKLDAYMKKVEEEKRAMTSEESADFEKITAEINSLDKTLNLVEEARSFSLKKGTETNVDPKAADTAKEERRAFDLFLRNKPAEQRADAVNMTTGENGAIIPKTIANKIIETVKNISPIFQMSSKFNVKGDLVFPVYDETTGKVTCAYADEFKALVSSTGKFTSITLGGYLSGALAKVSLSLINNNDFDLVNYVITKVAEAVAIFMEHEMLLGNTKMQGLINCAAKHVVTAASALTITADDLISLESNVLQRYRKNGCWIMSTATFTAIKKLKDAQGNYLFQRDLTNDFGGMLLGHPVYESDQMAEIAAGAFTVAFGDMSGMYTKLVNNPEIQVLREKFADEHCVGVIGWVETDSKIVEPQKLAIMKQAAA